MKRDAPLHALLIQLEFSTWKIARPWAYTGNFAFEEALRANGVDCFTLPTMGWTPASSPASWLFHARELCAGKHFDQVWVWLVHSQYDPAFLEWLTTVAPVRVGYLMESLRYDHEDYTLAPNLLNRPAKVSQQLQYMTHVLTTDEKDAEEINAGGQVKAIWWPLPVPERAVRRHSPAPNQVAAFYGTPYGVRADWLTHPDLTGLLVRPAPPENTTDYPRQFDELHQMVTTFLQSGAPVTETVLLKYVDALRLIRQGIFEHWMAGLRNWAAVVNLPSLGKVYTSRVAEAMAVGVPVLSWEIPDRPRYRTLFENGKEILLFDRSRPDQLAAHIRRIQREPDFARYLAENAHDKILRYHTAETRMRKIMDWIATGVEPDYGEKRSGDTTDSTTACASGISPSLSTGTAVRRSRSGQSAASPAESTAETRILFIKPDYTARSRPEYFLDQLAGVVCQPDVYPIAAFLGHQLGCSHIIDIGCGNAEKLVALYPQFQIIGIDYGPNLQFCRQTYPFGQWVDLNLESDSAIPIDPATLKQSIVICADVIEHLIDPVTLLRKIKCLLDYAPVVILTTPERDLTHGTNHQGPPPNPCHVREWNLEELERLLRFNTLNVLVTGLTNNNNIQLRKENSIVFIGNNYIAPSGALLDAIEAVAARWLDRPPQPSLNRYPVGRTAEPAPTRVAQTNAADHMWPAQVSGYVQQAEAHFVQGDLSAARDTLGKALALVPGDAQLLIAHANIVLRLGDTDGALREFTQAATLAPDSAPAHLNLAAVLLMLGRRQEAETSVRQALALRPGDVEAFKLLGRICFEAGRHVEGATAYTEALRNNPNDIESLLVLGKWAFEMGDRVTAQRMYGQALQVDPNNQVARESLGLLKEQAAGTVGVEQLPVVKKAPGGSWQPTDRLRLLLVVHGFPPKQIGGTELYTYALAKEFQRRGHAVRVLCPEYGSNRVEGTITNAVYEGLDVARIQVGRGDFISQFNNERLLPALRRYVADLAVDLVHVHHLIGISASASRVFVERGIPMVMTMHDEWLLCPQCHLLQPDGTFCKDGPETVDKCVHCLVERSGQSAQSERLPEIFYALALRRQVLQKTAGFIDTFIVPSQFVGEKLRRHGFDHPRITVSPLGLPPFRPLPWRPRTDRLRFTFLGSICFTKGLDLATRAFDRVDPDKARLDLYGQILDAVYFNQAMSYVRPGHQVKYHGPYSSTDLPSILAETDVALIPSRSENYPCVVRESLHAGVPVIAPNVGGVPEILRDGENGLLFEPGDYEDLARKLCFFVSSPNRVMTFRERIRPVRTISEDADQLEAIYKDALVRQSDAGEVQVAAAPTSLDDVSAWLRRADERAAEGDWAAAHDALKEAHARVPDNPQVIVALGNVKLRLGDVEAARREFVKATALSPEYIPAHNNLAAVLLHLGQAEEAEVSARRALALESNNLSALKVLARICLDSRRYTEAVQAYVTILRENPSDLETLLVVGNCYAEAGRPEDAKVFYQRVLQLDPGNAVAAENVTIVEGVGLRSEGAIARIDGPSDEKQTSIIILTHNGLEHTEKCLTSIAAHTQEPHELIIVDNGSTDGTLEYLRNYMASHANMRVIANRSNRGFAAGNNQGLALAKGEYVLLLNNDTIVTQGWLGRMLAVLRKYPGVGIVGPMSNYAVEPQLVSDTPYTNPDELELFAARWAAEHTGRNVPVVRVVGFCLLARKQVVERIGGLDEQFGSGNFEDDDFCIRAIQAGYSVRIAEDVFIHHTGSQTFEIAKIDHLESMQRNWELFKRKWGIPADSPPEKGYRLPRQPPDGQHSLIPLPDVSADHREEGEGRWWQEVSKAAETASRASSVAEPLSAVIVGNGHGLAPLWPSLVQHTNHPLAITILPSAGNGHGSDPIDRPACPEGWRVRTGDLPDVRLLNQLLGSAHDDPVIVLSGSLILTPGWLKRLLAALKRDQRLAAVGPTSNQGAAPQRVKAEYKGTGKALRQFALRRAHRYGEELAEVDSLAPFCIVFKPSACRSIGSFREDLDLVASLHEYVARLWQAGCTVGVALDAYVHCESSDPPS